MNRIVIVIDNGQVAGVVTGTETEVIVLDKAFGEFFIDAPATPLIIPDVMASFERSFEGYHE